MSIRTTLLLTLIFCFSGCVGKRPAVVRLLPDGVEEKPLELERVSRMGFSPPTEGEVRTPFRASEDASVLWLGCGVGSDGERAEFRAWLRSSTEDSQLVFSRVATPGE